MMNAASTSNPSFIVDVGEAYPYPSHAIAPNFVTVILSGKNKYSLWETQMLCLLKSHHMVGFIDGQFLSPAGNGKGKVGDKEAWVASDSLVKGWIFGSLSEEAGRKAVNHLKHKQKNTDFTAKDLWDELQRSYGPSVREQASVFYNLDNEIEIFDHVETKLTPRQAEPEIEVIAVSEDAKSKYEPTVDEKNRKERNKRELYDSIIEGGMYFPIYLLNADGLKPWDKLTNNGNTVLHVAVGSSTKNHELLKELLKMTPKENTLLDVVNSDGSTLLHVAAIGGNIEVVDILVERNPELLLAKDKEGHTPLALSISNMHTKTSHCLFEHMKEKEYDALFTGKSCEELVVLAISCQDFSLANWIINDYYPNAILPNSEAVLTALAQNFPRELNYWERRGDEFVSITFQLITKHLYTNFFIYVADFSYEFDRTSQPYRAPSYRLEEHLNDHQLFITCVAFFVVRLFFEDTFQIHNDAKNLLNYVCWTICDRHNSSNYYQYYATATFEATRRNASTFIRRIMSWFPNAIWSTNEDGHNFIQYSVINRSEKVYNLLYEMSEHKNIYKTIKDSSGNNLLHLAARLAPTNKLNLISGAALQIQRELQWFKEVEQFVCPLNRIQKNLDGETPQEVFTREHKALVIEGENWIKKTAESYTITAALIITIVFAAAITIPGGNNQDSGIPIFTNHIAFKVFAISDAISLFTAVTSLLLFLSILTARFAEQDFLLKLPTKLIIGLTMLFLSTTAMIIAFGATLFLVFGQSNSSTLIPIGALTCLPITSFVTLQFPLIVELIRATYCGGFFVREKFVYFY
ncbi:ankyrin repeat-containing domain, PGG domain protein [Artemisia annua]|uniref:Ankyrin repeat-containing domain, PGG domain protein n=1 Tax=Artemisia annua TaxID=35608 RepID=A0A2U1LJD9_ARTAN|nr:ankyrin repeat-containing domain, PGG domain protein [Artemisia annua]